MRFISACTCLIFGRILILPVVAASSVYHAQRDPCFCRPSQPCWPTESDLTEFASRLSSPLALLTNIRPPEYVCHLPDYDEVLCNTTRVSYSNPYWKASQPGAMQSPAYEASESGNTLNVCSLNGTKYEPCGQGNVPTFGIKAGAEQDIVEAMNFAQLHNLKVVVKSTGHDFLGRSTASDAFLVWTHNLKNISILRSFTPQGCSDPSHSYENALQLSAGVQWHEAYTAVFDAGLVVVGGFSQNGTVGAAGGWVLGAGHSLLSPIYGLGVDNVLQFRVVVPGSHGAGAKVMIVSACENVELFWALRGGGGGSFGVVTEVIYRTYVDSPGLFASYLATTNNPSSFRKLLRTYLAAQPGLADSGWGGYSYMINNTDNFTLGLWYLQPRATPNAINPLNATIMALFGKLSALPGVNTSLATTSPAGSFKEWYSQWADYLSSPDTVSAPGQAGEPFYFVSRLLPVDVHQGKKGEQLADFIARQGFGLGCLVAGGAVSKPSPDDMSLHPAWRTAITHFMTFNDPAHPDPSIAADLIDIIGGQGGGAYLNEAALEDPKWPYAFWGDHYERLKAIKKQVDPEYRLVVPKGVASDLFDDEVRCLKRV